MTNTLNTKQALAAQIKTNGSQYNEHERLAYCLMYLSSLLMANQAATVMREFTRGNDKYKLGQRMKGRKAELSELAARVSSQGDGDSWRISEDRIETRCALIAEFSIMTMQFNDCDEMIEFFSDHIDKLKLLAQNHQTLLNKKAKDNE